jgi:8-oxo-dGTP diphosphatase
VWRFDRGGHRLAVIHRPEHDDWSLPKGKLRDRESFPAAALREVVEETGCRPRLGEFAGYVLYERRGRSKLVMFWHMAARRVDPFVPNDEVDRVEWLTVEEALACLDHAPERQLLRSAVLALDALAQGPGAPAVGPSGGGGGGSRAAASPAT